MAAAIRFLTKNPLSTRNPPMMLSRISATALPLVLLAALACAPGAAHADETSSAAFASAPKLTVSKTELINVGGWRLESAQTLTGTAIDALTASGLEVKIAFEMDGMRADVGCNKLAGTYRAGSGKITTDLAITTRMACDDAKNRAEAALTEMFKQNFKAELRQSEPMRLRLVGENGDVLMFAAMPLNF
jgi:heat shock protein HslJ